MDLSSSARATVTGATALLAGALVLVPAAAAAAPAEPAPPHPRPATARSLLSRPGVQAQPLPGTPAPPRSVSALSWLVADAASGEVLAARDAHRRLPPASTLKSLFALTALPRLDASRRHKVTERELAGTGEGSSLVGVVPGLSYRVADLWRGVFLNSGNDAVSVLSSMIGGRRAAVRQMQAKARELGARDTHVVSPDGYDAPGQVSSAFDLAVFGREGLRDKEFAGYCGTAEADFPGDGASFGIRNTNRLLTGANGVGRYPGLVGVKNGYTSHAGNTLIAAAHRGGRTLLVTVMNPQKGDGLAVYQEARALLDWGFRAAGHTTAVGVLSGPRPSPRATRPSAPAVRTAAASAGTALRGPLLWAAGVAVLAGGAVLAVRRRRAG